MFKFISQAFFLQNLMAKGLALFPPVVDHNIGKYAALKRSFFLTSLEGLEGDYIEFGVFTGSSFQAAIEFSRRPIVAPPKPMRYFGFDSFKGFGTLDEKDSHPFYKDTHFETNKDRVESRLQSLLKDRSRVKLVDGFFEDSLAGKSPSDYGIGKAAVVMVDCDTFSAGQLVFNFIRTTLQDGTILILDDYFSYKGSSVRGICGAFAAFQSAVPQWTFRRIMDYGCGGAVFIANSEK